MAMPVPSPHGDPFRGARVSGGASESDRNDNPANHLDQGVTTTHNPMTTVMEIVNARLQAGINPARKRLATSQARVAPDSAPIT